MFRKCIAFAVFALGALGIVVAGVAQQGPTEAPTGFDTPTLAQDPGSQSVSNGIAEPSGDTYALDQTRFEQDHECTTTRRFWPSRPRTGSNRANPDC